MNDRADAVQMVEPGVALWDMGDVPDPQSWSLSVCCGTTKRLEKLVRRLFRAMPEYASIVRWHFNDLETQAGSPERADHERGMSLPIIDGLDFVIIESNRRLTLSTRMNTASFPSSLLASMNPRTTFYVAGDDPFGPSDVGEPLAPHAGYVDKMLVWKVRAMWPERMVLRGCGIPFQRVFQWIGPSARIRNMEQRLSGMGIPRASSPKELSRALQKIERRCIERREE